MQRGGVVVILKAVLMSSIINEKYPPSAYRVSTLVLAFWDTRGVKCTKDVSRKCERTDVLLFLIEGVVGKPFAF